MEKITKYSDIEGLDDFDYKILTELGNNGRITMTELATRVGLSKTPCHQRVKRLEREGYILGYYTALNAQKLHRAHIAFVEVKLNDTREATLNKFNEMVRKLPAIEQCHLIAGRFDYLLKVRARNMREYRSILGEQISTLPGVAYTSTNAVMESVKEVFIAG